MKVGIVTPIHKNYSLNTRQKRYSNFVILTLEIDVEYFQQNNCTMPNYSGNGKSFSTPGWNAVFCASFCDDYLQIESEATNEIGTKRKIRFEDRRQGIHSKVFIPIHPDWKNHINKKDCIANYTFSYLLKIIVSPIISNTTNWRKTMFQFVFPRLQVLAVDAPKEHVRAKPSK